MLLLRYMYNVSLSVAPWHCIELAEAIEMQLTLDRIHARCFLENSVCFPIGIRGPNT